MHVCGLAHTTCAHTRTRTPSRLQGARHRPQRGPGRCPARVAGGQVQAAEGGGSVPAPILAGTPARAAGPAHAAHGRPVYCPGPCWWRWQQRQQRQWQRRSGRPAVGGAQDLGQLQPRAAAGAGGGRGRGCGGAAMARGRGRRWAPSVCEQGCRWWTGCGRALTCAHGAWVPAGGTSTSGGAPDGWPASDSSSSSGGSGPTSAAAQLPDGQPVEWEAHNAARHMGRALARYLVGSGACRRGECLKPGACTRGRGAQQRADGTQARRVRACCWRPL